MTLAANILTLADWAKRLDPDGKVPEIVELLSQTNEILTDMLFMEGNLPTGHRTTVRTGLPSVAWRLLNAGVQPSKSTTAQIDEGCGMLESWSEVDEALARLNGNVAAFRLSEGKAFMEAMNQEMASTLFYGNSSVSPEEFTGLAIRYSDLDATNGSNIIDGGGVGAVNSSIWLIVWGAQSVFGIFPKGSKAGIEHLDRGLETVENAGGVTGAKMLAYRERWKWDCGIALKDWRFVARICNVDVTNLVAESSNADLIKLMIKAIHAVGASNMKLGKPAFYINRTLFQMLDIQRRDGVMAGGGITYRDVDGVVQYSFRGIPIRNCDALLETEAAVTT